MKLKDLGFSENIQHPGKDHEREGFQLGRVTREHRERYIVCDGEQEFEAEITGNLRFSAISRADFPAVGDWVTIKTYDHGQAIIHRVLPRKSLLGRQAVMKPGEIQVIAANIDTALIMQSIDNNFNLNRLERYMSVCHSAGIEPVLIISKIDLAAEEIINATVKKLTAREKELKYILLSNMTHQGIEEITEFLKAGRTYCVIGSSGVGKSTLINTLIKKDILRTKSISKSTGKGKHTTEHRELFVLDNGAILIDTPGMREFGITDDSKGIESTFRELYDLSVNCMFRDCRHINEKGCAVLQAVREGKIEKSTLENYHKLIKEQQRFQSTAAEKHRQDKIFGKILKRYKKDMDGNM